MSVLCALLAQASEQNPASELKEGWGSLIFVGAFFLVVILVGIWWLRRG